MSSVVTRNAWGEIIHHEGDGILELRWLPTAMTDGAFKATLALFALEGERARPSFLLIDATQFRHQFGPGVMQWRDDCIIPRYGAAGAPEVSFQDSSGLPGTRRRSHAGKLCTASIAQAVTAQTCAEATWAARTCCVRRLR